MQTFLRNLKYCTNLSVSTVCALPGYQNNFRLSLSNLRKTLKTCIIPFTVRKDFPMSTHLVRMNSDNEMHLPPSLQYIAGSFYPSVIQFHKMLARVANLRVLSLTMSNQEFGKCLGPLEVVTRHLISLQEINLYLSGEAPVNHDWNLGSYSWIKKVQVLQFPIGQRVNSNIFFNIRYFERLKSLKAEIEGPSSLRGNFSLSFLSGGINSSQFTQFRLSCFIHYKLEAPSFPDQAKAKDEIY